MKSDVEKELGRDLTEQEIEMLRSYADSRVTVVLGEFDEPS